MQISSKIISQSVKAEFQYALSSLHSGRSLAWDHFRSDIDDPCRVIADFCGVIADPCSDRRWRSLRDSLNIGKHHETLVKHCDTS